MSASWLKRDCEDPPPQAGPEVRRKLLKITLPTGSGRKVVRPLCVDEGGFSLHAATRAGAEDELGRENLFKYVLRPPIAQEHVTLTADGLVAVTLKKPFRDGTVSVEIDPLSLISRLATSVHPPRFHSVRYGGVLAPHSRWRSLIVPSPPPTAPSAPSARAEPGCHSPPRKDDESAKPPTHRCRYRPWHELMRRCMKIDVETCGRCGGNMRLVALVDRKSVV